jgi:hypothetical protein
LVSPEPFPIAASGTKRRSTHAAIAVAGHVNERLKESAETLHEEQQALGDGLDGAARVVGSVHGSLSGLQEAKGMNIENAA